LRPDFREPRPEATWIEAGVRADQLKVIRVFKQELLRQSAISQRPALPLLYRLCHNGEPQSALTIEIVRLTPALLDLPLYRLHVRPLGWCRNSTAPLRHREKHESSQGTAIVSTRKVSA
jgi:hypothetical protein